MEASNYTDVAAQEAEQVRLRKEKLRELDRIDNPNQPDPPDQPVFGVAFSGGGIRSATFNLGIVQGLAKSGLLRRVDYLSTVSGGGYVGTWLHGVIKRYAQGDPRGENLKQLLTRPESVPHGRPIEDPISFLRQYTSYLAPDFSLFSADFWALVGIWFRNILLNQLILLPFLVAASLTPLLIASAAAWYAYRVLDGYIGDLIFALIALIVVVICAGRGVGAIAVGKVKGKWDSARNATTCAGLALLASMGMALAGDGLWDHKWLRFDDSLEGVPKGVITLAALSLTFSIMFAILQWQGKYSTCFFKRHHKYPKFGSWAYPLMAGTTAGSLLFVLLRALVMADRLTAGVWNTVAWGPPVLSVAMLIGASLHVGLMGVDYPDEAREWLGRLAAYTGLFGFAWAGLFAICVFGPLWITTLAVKSWILVAGLGGGWLATSFAGAMAGSSSRTAGGGSTVPSNGGIRGLIVSLAPTVFVIGYLLVLSFGLHLTVARLIGANPDMKPVLEIPSTLQISAQATGADSVQVDLRNTEKPPPSALVAAWKTEKALLAQYDDAKEVPVFHDFLPHLVAVSELLLGTLILLWYLPRRIDINEFSMHHFYKNRLVRSYLGATNGANRKPSRLTGFDPNDDIPIRDFAADKDYLGPYPLVNTCLNLTHGEDMAKAERKGMAFLFSPHYSGYDAEGYNGYRPTEGYGYPQGFRIGTCMGISGAAASPNGGTSTSAPMSFLMTIFCVRLGWWVGNTRYSAPSSEPGPTNSLVALLSELFASTDATSKFLNISDGGHFENLGLYELVRRRCAFIVAGDGEQDAGYNFESLGGAVRKCRTDFGADIEIDPRRIKPPKDGLSMTHCVVGRITYAPLPGENRRATGWLLYLKSSLTGDEPEDVAQFKASHWDFPQETTANQFFTESQFESYRKLGLHVWESAFADIDFEGGHANLEHIFSSLYRWWYPPTDVAAGVESRHTDAYSALVNKLADPILGRLSDQLIAPNGIPDHVGVMPAGLTPDEQNKVFLYTLEFVQLIENVWADLEFRKAANRNSPANSGWMTVFRFWYRQPAFEDAWQRAGYSYNGLFQQFYNSLGDEPPA